jgi:hypothetical protein
MREDYPILTDVGKAFCAPARISGSRKINGIYKREKFGIL